MKNLVTILLMAMALSLYAQPLEKNKEHPRFTPDQIAELQTKRMTLHLELNETQQQQILEINKKNASERIQKKEVRKAIRKKGEKPTTNALFKIKSDRLDAQIAHQNEMKNILDEKQFETWKKMRFHKKHKLKKRLYKNKMQRK